MALLATQTSSRRVRESGHPEGWLYGTIHGVRRASVYILASRRNGTLYVAVTSDLARRIWEHKTGAAPGFTEKYGVHLLPDLY